MASLNQLLSTPGLAQGLTCIQGEGYRAAGLPSLPFPLIWEYQTDYAGSCSDPKSWLPAADLVGIQRSLTPGFWEGVGQDLVGLSKAMLPVFLTGNPLSFIKAAQATIAEAERRQDQAEAVVRQAEQLTERVQAQFLANQPQPPTSLGDPDMAIFDDFGLDAAFDFVGDFFEGVSESVDFSDVLNVGVPLLTNQITSLAGRPPTGVLPPAPRPSVPNPSVPRMPGLGGAIVGRRFFNKWPNLATAIQRLRNAGQRISRSQLYGMLKRFGPEFLIGAGILTAAAVNELAMAGPGHRRMNPANVKALRRSMRRLNSFHKLCNKTDMLRRPRRKKC